jgi:signal transduction histidine kinase/CheY-like chemotaxis protein
MTSIHDDDPGSRSDSASTVSGGPPPQWERLARRLDALETVLAAGRIGYCRLRAADLALAANTQFKEQWGWPPDAALSWEALTSRVHGEDRERLADAVRGALAGCGRVDLTVRVLPPVEPGPVRWLALGGCRVSDADEGGGAELVLTCQDVSHEQRAREVAEAANRAKDEFLSVISHELRSPLNAILGWNRILALKCAGEAEVAAITPRIEQSAKAQLKMVNDLLDLGRVSTGKLKVERRRMQLARVARLVIDGVRPAAAAKAIEIETRFDAGAGELYADSDRLQQVIGNLLSNAVKFTGSGGRIAVGLRDDGAFTELTVRDTGQGIAPELLPHIFDRFRQGDSSSTRHSSGLGLGLTLVREIVALHGGSVSAHSAGAGAGAIFSVRLPTVRATGESPVHDPADPRRSSGEQQTLAGLSILVVDDELEARTVVAEMLRLEGAAVTVTDCASAALHELRSQSPPFDIIVTDIGMPSEDGYSLVRKLRASEAGRGMLAIAVTGYASRNDVAAAMSAGFDLHVPKPVDFDTFVPLVRRLVLRGMPSRQKKSGLVAPQPAKRGV